jgi:hypothetical protein
VVSILEEGDRFLLFDIRHTLLATDYHKTKPSAPSTIASGPPGEAEAPAGARHQEHLEGALSGHLHFERYLTRNGVVIREFFLNLSKKEQKRRFLERLEERSPSRAAREVRIFSTRWLGV